MVPASSPGHGRVWGGCLGLTPLRLRGGLSQQKPTCPVCVWMCVYVQWTLSRGLAGCEALPSSLSRGHPRRRMWAKPMFGD